MKPTVVLVPAPQAAPFAPSAQPLPPRQRFIRDLLVATWHALRGRRLFGWREVLQHIDETGPRSLPIVALTCGLVGLMLAYMGGAQLGRIGAQTYVADIVTVGMVRELAGLMTGIILAGRVSATFAAHLGAMTANEEIDALKVFGIDPIGYLVLPRLIALMVVFPFLMAFGAVVGMMAGWVPAVLSYGANSAEYVEHSLRAINFTHVSIGGFKGLLYAVLLALAGCREGLNAGRSAQAVGVATTRAVVQALVWIVAAACASTVVFTLLGY
ncbi:MAG: ABC transporter permease [Burkholderiaceae bacterium]|nr:ABC transporter permease [Burkholderiaceae bacterium]